MSSGGPSVMESESQTIQNQAIAPLTMMQPMSHPCNGRRARSGIFTNGPIGNRLIHLLGHLKTFRHGLEFTQRTQITKKTDTLLARVEFQYGIKEFIGRAVGPLGHGKMFYVECFNVIQHYTNRKPLSTLF